MELVDRMVFNAFWNQSQRSAKPLLWTYVYKAFNFAIAPTSVQLMFLQVTWKFNVPPLKFSCDTKANMLWDLQVEMISHDFTMFHLSAIHRKPSFLLLFCKARETCFAQAVTIDLTDSE